MQKKVNTGDKACKFVISKGDDSQCWNGTHVAAYIHPTATFDLEDQVKNLTTVEPPIDNSKGGI